MSALFQAPLRFMSIPATVPGQRAEAARPKAKPGLSGMAL